MQLLSALPSVQEVPSSIPCVTTNPFFDFFPFRVALSCFKFPLNVALKERGGKMTSPSALGLLVR